MVNTFGGVVIDEIREAATEMPFPENAGSTPIVRFTRKVSELVSERTQHGGEGGIALFLKSESLVSDAEGCGGTLFPALSSGNDPICGNVWLSNAVLGGAYALNIDCGELDKVFQELRSSTFAELPAVLVDWRGATPVAKLYLKGVSDLENVVDVALEHYEISVTELKECLDHFHNSSIATPMRSREGHAEAIWNDARKGHPAHRPEERIQGKLINHLKSRYSKHVIRAEEKNDDGITDLVISAHIVGASGKKAIVVEWILELKALTDKTETGRDVPQSNVRGRVIEGLSQAISYRSKEHSNNGALCCYDMRLHDEGDKACFAEVLDEAANENIFLWRWFLHRSSKDLRKAGRTSRTALATS